MICQTVPGRYLPPLDTTPGLNAFSLRRRSIGRVLWALILIRGHPSHREISSVRTYVHGARLIFWIVLFFGKLRRPVLKADSGPSEVSIFFLYLHRHCGHRVFFGSFHGSDSLLSRGVYTFVIYTYRHYPDKSSLDLLRRTFSRARMDQRSLTSTILSQSTSCLLSHADLRRNHRSHRLSPRFWCVISVRWSFASVSSPPWRGLSDGSTGL